MRGFSDLKIGTVGLERLKKTAEIHQLSAHVTSLPLVIPFLELSANQEYLVQRIRELAKGSSINDYRWNSSYSYDHNEHITDAAVGTTHTHTHNLLASKSICHLRNCIVVTDYFPFVLRVH